MDWPTITLTDVLEARRNIGPYLRPTSLYPYAGLDELLGAEVWVKHETINRWAPSRFVAASTSSPNSAEASGGVD